MGQEFFAHGAFLKGDHRILEMMAELFLEIYVDLMMRSKGIIRLQDYGIALCQKYNVPSRFFHSVRYEVEALVKSYLECIKMDIENKEINIEVITKKIEKLITKLKKDPKNKKIKTDLFTARQKLVGFNRKLKRLTKELNDPSMMHGGIKLWNEQYWCPKEYKNSDHWRQVNYNAWCLYHTKWLYKWRSKRAKTFSFVGNKAENTGNVSCIAEVNVKGLIDLKLNIPTCLRTDEKYYIIKDLYFYQNHQLVVNTIYANKDKKTVKPITYRFVKESNGWSIYAVFAEDATPKFFTCNRIGIDLNVGFITYTIISPDGNKIKFGRIEMDLRNKSSEESNRIICEVVKDICDLCIKYSAALVIEDLDFKKKRQLLAQSNNKKMNKMISNFAYAKFRNAIKSRCFRQGITLIKVDTHYTSFIGRNKYMRMYGISVHSAASFIIARRSFGFSERFIDNKFVANSGKVISVFLPDWKKPQASIIGTIFGKYNNALVEKSRLVKAPVPKLLGINSAGRQGQQTILYDGNRGIIRLNIQFN